MEDHITTEKPASHGLKPNFNLKTVAFLLIGLAIGALLTFGIFSFSGGGLSATITGNAAASKAIDFVNTNLLSAQGLSAELVDVNDSGELYTVNFLVKQGDEVLQPGSIYVTKNGESMLIGQLINLNEELPTADVPADEADKPAAPEATKTDKPIVDMFVMSYCPYGTQAENGLFPVADLLGDKIEFNPHFVIYSNYCQKQNCSAEDLANFCFDAEGKYCSMHGLGEINEDVRQMVVAKYYPEKFIEYVNAINTGTTSKDVDEKWTAIATSVGLDADEIQKKFDAEADTLLAAELALNKELGVSGSPTIFINDVKYSGGRTPADFQEAICAAFNTAPSECGETINSTATAAPSGGCGA